MLYQTCMPRTACNVRHNPEGRSSSSAVGRFLVDTPEAIWGALDAGNYLEGTLRFLRASSLHEELTTGSRAAAVATRFPLLRQQWPLVANFRSAARLFITSAVGRVRQGLKIVQGTPGTRCSWGQYSNVHGSECLRLILCANLPGVPWHSLWLRGLAWDVHPWLWFLMWMTRPRRYHDFPEARRMHKLTCHMKAHVLAAFSPEAKAPLQGSCLPLSHHPCPGMQNICEQR